MIAFKFYQEDAYLLKQRASIMQQIATCIVAINYINLATSKASSRSCGNG